MRYIWVLLFVASLSLLACTDGSKESAATLSPALQQVESIMYQAPDSALRLLEAMSVPPASDSLNLATWALFTTQARYKLFMSQSDSLINVAYPYFLRHGDAQRKAMALYYKGAICKEHQHIEEAQRNLLKASGEVEKTTDYLLAHLIYEEIADTYVYRNLYDSGKEAAQKAYEYAQKSGNSSYIISSLTVLARVYSKLNELNNAVECYKKAIEVAKEKEQYEVIGGNIIELLGIYFSLKDYISVRHYVTHFLVLQKEHNFELTASQYSVIGKAYHLMNKPDSAYYYLKKGGEVPDSATNVYVQRGLYERLSDLAFEQGDYKEAALYSRKESAYKDSIHLLDKSQEIAEIQEKYDQQKIINERNELRIKNDRIVRNMLLMLSLALCIISILIYKLFKKERRIRKAEGQAHSKTLCIQQNELTISRNLKRIAELEEQMEVNARQQTDIQKDMQEEMEEQKKALSDIRKQNERLEQKNQTLQKDIDTLSGTLKDKSKELEQLDHLTKENLRLHDREWLLINMVLQSNELLCKLRQSPRYIHDNEWERIKTLINNVFERYSQRLLGVIPSLTENELQLCLLIKLHFSNVAIAAMLGIEPQSVAKRKFRLKEHISRTITELKDGMSLDLWIWNF